MTVIIIEDDVYKVSEKEYKKLREMVDVCRISSNPPDELNDYMDEAKKDYTYIGPVMLDWRR